MFYAFVYGHANLRSFGVWSREAWRRLISWPGLAWFVFMGDGLLDWEISHRCWRMGNRLGISVESVCAVCGLDGQIVHQPVNWTSSKPRRFNSYCDTTPKTNRCISFMIVVIVMPISSTTLWFPIAGAPNLLSRAAPTRSRGIEPQRISGSPNEASMPGAKRLGG